MKKILSISLVLIMIMSLFSGCNIAEKIAGNKEISHEGLTMEIPTLFMDLSSIVDNDSITFIYGLDDSAVVGIRESREELAEYYDDLQTAQDYAEVFIAANELDATVSEKDGLPTFTYEATVDGEAYTYLCAAFSNEEDFWVVQTYSFSKSFSDNEADFWKMLKTVEV